MPRSGALSEPSPGGGETAHQPAEDAGCTGSPQGLRVPTGWAPLGVALQQKALLPRPPYDLGGALAGRALEVGEGGVGEADDRALGVGVPPRSGGRCWVRLAGGGRRPARVVAIATIPLCVP